MNFKPVVLIVFDGFGVNTLPGESPMQVAKKPNIDEISAYYPVTTLQASGLAVGLPWGEEGNSEVGHLTMGSGRTLYHHLPRIIVSIQDGSFFDNKAFLDAVEHVKANKGKLNIMGLLSSGSVHAYVDHLYALLALAKREAVGEVALHIFGDGRDSPTQELKVFLPQLEARMKSEYPNAYIATLMGRHYSMDREERWELVQKAYECLIGRNGATFSEPKKYLTDSYSAGVTDEFLVPSWKVDEKAVPQGRINDGDAVVFYNFREDSVRELTHAFLEDGFKHFDQKSFANLFFVTMTEYERGLSAHVAFPPLDVEWPLSRVISNAGKSQLHVAETEKYAHVTYFFNGGREKPYPKEDRRLVPSARVPFDQKPEMSAYEITEIVISEIEKYDFVLVNFANADMVGHTGSFEATTRAIEVLDECFGKIHKKVIDLKGALILTADHGNAEEKRYRLTGERRTKHSTNPVPFYVVAEQFKRAEPRSEKKIHDCLSNVEGVLADVAPTVLDLMGLEVPSEMTGINLLSRLLL